MESSRTARSCVVQLVAPAIAKLTHTIPKDAAVEFAPSMQGMPTVKMTGGGVPVSEKQTLGGATVGTETGRRCSFKWGGYPEQPHR